MKTDLAAAESRILETTKADLAAAESRIIEQVTEEVTDRLTEMLRGIETSLLRAFHSYSQGVEVRMRRIEADSRNIDVESKGRLEAL
jgi:putative heme iron utilization protein